MPGCGASGRLEQEHAAAGAVRWRRAPCPGRRQSASCGAPGWRHDDQAARQLFGLIRRRGCPRKPCAARRRQVQRQAQQLVRARDRARPRATRATRRSMRAKSSMLMVCGGAGEAPGNTGAARAVGAVLVAGAERQPDWRRGWPPRARLWIDQRRDRGRVEPRRERLGRRRARRRAAARVPRPSRRNCVPRKVAADCVMCGSTGAR